MEITTTCSLGYPMIMEFVMLNGIGSMPEIIAANVAWIWSVLKPNKNMNGSNKSWEVSKTKDWQLKNETEFFYNSSKSIVGTIIYCMLF